MLTLTNITKTFAAGTVNEKTALAGIDLHLDAGDFVTVLGSNGAGKSTLFGAIAGTFLPDTGNIVLDGQDITNLPDYKRSKYIGRMFQDPLKGTAPNMTIEENLALAKELGYRTVFWSLAYADWDNAHQPTAQQAFDKLLPRTHNGAIVLLHATSATNAQILDELLTKWETLGYRFAPLTDLDF